MYTKIPLSTLVIKEEIEKGEKIVVYNIHFSVLLAYKSNSIINIRKQKENISRFL
jgi:hypothetical protein